MLIAVMFDKGKKDAVSYVLKLAEMLELTKENILMLSNLAAVALTQNANYYKCEINNNYEMFKCYLNKIEWFKDVQIMRCLFNYSFTSFSIAKRFHSTDETYDNYCNDVY